MPAYPPEILAAAAAAIEIELTGGVSYDCRIEESLARAALDAAAPLLAESVAVTEYGQLMSGGGFQTFNDSPEIEEIYPLAKRIEAGMRFGGHVYRRRIVVVEDWEEITEAPGERK